MNNMNQLNLMFRNIDKILSSIQTPINNFKNNENYKNKSFKILDIGSSKGKNSNIFLCELISNIKKQISDDIVIEVIHCDLEINDFTKLFIEINNNVEFYKNKYNNIYSYAIGNTFLNQLVPNNSCEVIFSFNCFHWCDFNDGYFNSNKNSLIKVQRDLETNISQFNKDRLLKIFKLRSNELSNDGILICNFLIYEPENSDSYSIEIAFANIKSIFREMVNENILSDQEVDNMVLPITFYSKEEVEYAINSVEKYGLKLIHLEKYYLNWVKCLNNTSNSNQIIISNMMEFCESSIKRAIKGDEIKVNSIYNEFYKRVVQQYDSNSNLLDLTLAFKLTIFKKTN